MEEICAAKERSLLIRGEQLGCLLRQQNSTNFMTARPCSVYCDENHIIWASVISSTAGQKGLVLGFREGLTCTHE